MDYLSATVMLFFIMDPLGNIPNFHFILGEIPLEQRPRIIARELLIAYFILLIFLLVGGYILSFLGLKQPSLSIAGGVILFLIGLGMVFPQYGIKAAFEKEDPFIVPLAVPLIAGPSSIAVLLLLTSSQPDKLLVWVGSLSTAWGICAVILLLSNSFLKVIGERGLRAAVRLMGMLLIMMAVQMLLDGIKNYLATIQS